MLKSKTLVKAVRPMVMVTFLMVLLVAFVSFNVNCAYAAEWDKPGYTMTFHDEFDGNSIDSTKWNDWDINFGTRGPGIIGANNGYAYCPENVRVSGGQVSITCTRDPITAPLCGGGTKTVNYRVGEINTQNKFQQTYGWFEARMKFPKARALYPAFWLMPGRGLTMIEQNGPGTGSGAEVDIMEYQTYWMGKQVTSSIWYGGYGANLQGGGIGTTYSPISSTDGWHVYALNWEQGKLEIFVDGVKTQTYTGEGVPSGDEIIILSMAEGSWGMSVLDSELPDSMLVDYVRVYKKGALTPITPSNPKPTTPSNPTIDSAPSPNPDLAPAPDPTPVPDPAPSQVTYNDDSSNIKYTGSWKSNNNKLAYQGDFHYSKSRNDYYTINFTGTQLKTYVLKDRWAGKVAVYVDDVYKGKIDCYNRTALGNQLLYDTGALPSGNHTVKIVLLREKNSSSLGYYHYVDRVEVSNNGQTPNANNEETNDNDIVPEDNETVPNANDAVYNDDSFNIKYTGSWKSNNNKLAYQGDFHYSKSRNDYYTINFTGTQLKTYVLKDRWAGKVAVYVDDVYKGKIDCYNRTALGNQLLYDTGVLPSGNHTVKIVLLREKNFSSLGYYHYLDSSQIYN